jgi:hypothetical protein
LKKKSAGSSSPAALGSVLQRSNASQDERDSVIASMECRRLFLVAASAHPEIRLEESLRNHAFSSAQIGGDLDELLRKWAMGHRLQYDWVLQEAKLLYFCSQRPNSKELSTAITFESSMPVYEESFRLPPWVSTEDAVAYQKRTLRMFRTFLRESTERRKRLRRKFISARESLSVHYRWAAERICLNRSWADIARKHLRHVAWQSVEGAVTPILDSCGLDRRRTKPDHR